MMGDTQSRPASVEVGELVKELSILAAQLEMHGCGDGNSGHGHPPWMTARAKWLRQQAEMLKHLTASGKEITP